MTAVLAPEAVADLVATLSYEDETPIQLAGASVTCGIRPWRGTTDLDAGPAEIIGANQVRYRVAATLTTGNYRVRVIVTWPNGEVEVFPNVRSALLVVTRG